VTRTAPEPSGTVPSVSATSAPDEPARLDELMLAMDVVDTLRHERDLVERELGGEARANALVARLAEIYAGQGIAVPERILREGVAALEQDRFAYVPPPRTFEVRLAHLYVTRTRWLPVALIGGVALVGASIVLALALAANTRSERVAFQDAHLSAQGAVAVARTELERTVAAAATMRVGLSERVAPLAAPLWSAFDRERSEASDELAAAAGALETIHAAGPTRGARERFAATARQASGEVAEARAALAALEGLGRIDTAASEVVAALDAMELAGAAAARRALLRDELDAAIASGDLGEVEVATSALVALRLRLEQTYELRLVSRPGVDTGFWRDSATGGRNHYVVVEAIAPSGRALALPILNEETQRTETVDLFAIRVPEEVFARVRDDKLDNGIVDAPVVGGKARGSLDETFTIATSGGRITRW